MCWSILVRALLLLGVLHGKAMNAIDHDHMEPDDSLINEFQQQMEATSPYVYGEMESVEKIEAIKRLPVPSRFPVYRRVCIPRSGLCDNHPNDCCFNSSCRCNLWGNNCRCQRMGLFQKWG